jgi:hypothetical protein
VAPWLMVTMTVFITDTRYGDRFTQLRKEIFGDNFPASALITVAFFGLPSHDKRDSRQLGNDPISGS